MCADKNEKAEISGSLDDLILKLFCGEIPACQYFDGDVAEQNYVPRKLLQETFRFLAGNCVARNLISQTRYQTHGKLLQCDIT